jgi:hypothetical protein
VLTNFGLTINKRTEGQPLTRVWQKKRFNAPQTNLWFIKVWFSASSFVLKIGTFAKPQNVSGNPMKTDRATLNQQKNDKK